MGMKLLQSDKMYISDFSTLKTITEAEKHQLKLKLTDKL